MYSWFQSSRFLIPHAKLSRIPESRGKIFPDFRIHFSIHGVTWSEGVWNNYHTCLLLPVLRSELMACLIKAHFWISTFLKTFLSLFFECHCIDEKRRLHIKINKGPSQLTVPQYKIIMKIHAPSLLSPPCRQKIRSLIHSKNLTTLWRREEKLCLAEGTRHFPEKEGEKARWGCRACSSPFRTPW